MIVVDVRLHGVDDLGRELVDVILDDAVHLDVGEGVESHVRQVEVDVVLDAQLGRGSQRLLLLPSARRRVPRILAGASVGHDHHPHLVTRARVDGDGSAHAQDLVVRVRGDDEDPRHPSCTPTASSEACVSISSSSSAPSPHATTGPSGRLATIVPAGAAASSSTGRARQTTIFSSPRNVNAPG